MGGAQARAARLGMRVSGGAARFPAAVCSSFCLLIACTGCGSGGPAKNSPRVERMPDGKASASATVRHTSDNDPTGPSRYSLRAALVPAVNEVTAHEGTVQAAVMLDTWSQPLVLGEQLSTPMRLWSLSKAVVAVALLRARERLGQRDDDLQPYLERALERSDNCAMRDLTVNLQDTTGGIAGARRAIAEVVGRAGATIDLASAQTDRVGAVCLSPSYPDLSPGFATRTALLVGTATWTIADAIDFMHSLEAGSEDLPGHPSVGRVVLGLMRQPKRPSREPLAGTLTAIPSWGAGEVFRSACWQLAYKGGWGGAQAHIPWLASQMGVVALPDGHTLTFAVAVHPYEQPIDDDPGHTTAPRGISEVLRSLRGSLSTPGGCS